MWLVNLQFCPLERRAISRAKNNFQGKSCLNSSIVVSLRTIAHFSFCFVDVSCFLILMLALLSGIVIISSEKRKLVALLL